MANTITEHGEQVAFMDWCQLMINRGVYPELSLMYAIVNERGGSGSKTKSRIAMIEIEKAKAQGLKKGVPDLCLPVARGGFFGLYLETKVKPNRPTPEQIEWIEALTAQGYRAVVCYGYPGLRLEVESYLAMPATVPLILAENEKAAP